MNEADWIRLAQERADDAQSLLAIGRWPAAYYLAGYAVECRLKACILKRVVSDPGLVFDESKFAHKIWTHDLTVLLDHAGLLAHPQNSLNPRTAVSWSRVQSWKESSRYTLKSEIEAKNLVSAVIHATNGVLSWIDQNS